MTTDFTKLIHKISNDQHDSSSADINTNIQIQIDQLNAKLTEHINQYNNDIQDIIDIIDQIQNDR